MKNLSKFVKFTDFNKSQHSIYSKFQKCSNDSQNLKIQYQQKTYHEKKKNNFEKSENVSNQNFASNFVDLNENNNEIYYEKQSVNDDKEVFIEFIKIKFIRKRCEISFAFKNLLHNHICKIICLKQSN